MVRRNTEVIGLDRKAFLLCDIWYSKGYVAGILNEFHNFDIICNARIDTAMYGRRLELTRNRNCPKIYGAEDFELQTTKTGDWRIGVCSIFTKL